ncbi:MAG TPA: hypothetical protein VFJ15_08130 [Oleiagrimonas sp.]|nr:hypothetical protein [Oleiagrimonas sp.]
MTSETSVENSVENELQQREVKRQAAAIETAGMVKTGWIVLVVGWCAPIIPLLGFFLLGIAGFVGFVISLITIAKGNVGSGVFLLAGAWIGSGLAAAIWAGIYMIISSL